MNKKELEYVIKLTATKRYQYFIKKVSDFEEVWALYNNGWAVSEDEEGIPLIPFWPKKEFAEFSAIEDWSNYLPKKINLEEFMFKWLPGMKRDGFKPSIFWNNTDSIVVDIDDLLLHLEEELANY